MNVIFFLQTKFGIFLHITCLSAVKRREVNSQKKSGFLAHPVSGSHAIAILNDELTGCQ